MLTKRDQDKVSTELSSVAHRWKDIALVLGFSKAEVLTIDSSYDAIHQKLSVMVREWLMRAGNDPGRQPSWGTVVEALRSSGISSLAGNIELKYCSPNIPHVSLDSVSSSSSVSGDQGSDIQGQISTSRINNIQLAATVYISYCMGAVTIMLDVH